MRMWMGGLGGILLSSIATAGTIRHDKLDSDYTSLSAQSKYASVGALLWNQGSSGYIASGALVASDWVLTAGHVVGGTDNLGAGISNMRFLQGASVSGATPIFADQWLPLPGWNGSLAAGLDVGLVHLSSDIFSVTPAERYFGTGEKTLTGTHVGYGLTGTGSTGTVANSAGTRRAGNNVIDRFGPEVHSSYSSNIMFADFDQPGSPSQSSMGSNMPLTLEYQIAPGDSGGPLFIDVAGETLIAGVHSFIRSFDANGTNADYGDQSGSIRLNGVWNGSFTINDWISSVITTAGDADGDFDVDIDDLRALAASYGITTGGHWHLGDFDLDGDVDLNDLANLAAHYDGGAEAAMADFASVTSVPEPASLTALGAMGAVLIRRRRRSDLA